MRAPLVENPALNERIGGRVLMKAETLQRAGAFKFRGAYTALSAVDPDRRAAGVDRGEELVVALVDGELTFYLERGGKTLLVYSEREDAVGLAVRRLAALVRDGHIGSVTVHTINGEPAAASRWAEQLRGAGFGATPQGLRLRAGIGSGAGRA